MSTIRGLQPHHVKAARSLEPLIRENANQAEASRRLPQTVATAFAKQGLYRLGAPKELHGADADPATQIEVIEAISYADGSAGWNLMIGIEVFGQLAPLLGPNLPLIDDPAIVMCGATSAMGKAQHEREGYRVNGRWQFVSGCHNASIFTGLVRQYRGDERLERPPSLIVAQMDEFSILDTWNVSGMKGSGSHDVSIADHWFPKERLVVPSDVIIEGRTPLQRIPLGVKLAYNKIGVCLGIARAGLEAFTELASKKTPRFGSIKLRDRSFAQVAIAEAEIQVRGARALVFELVEELWEIVNKSEHIEDKWRAIFQIACSCAARSCVEAIDRIAEAAGTTPNFLGEPLERIVRDVRVVKQHVTVSPQHIEDGGRMLLGLPAQGMMLSPKYLEERPDQK